MATLERARTGKKVPLPSRALVGRSPACAIALEAALASGEHATLLWSGGRWDVRDLGSKNGTFVDGARIEPGRAHALAAGSSLAFGDKEDLWLLRDASAPEIMAIGDVGVFAGRHGLLVLPADSAPEASVFLDNKGQWVLESADGETRVVVDDSEIEVGGKIYRLQIPFVLQGTPLAAMGLTLDNVSLRFAVSRNEEHVELTLVHKDGELRLEAREHSYMLLTLARAREDDRELPISERGWLSRDQLLRMLSMTLNALHVAIHRSRQQLLDAGVDGATRIVEVRRGERRLGTDRFTIVPL